MSEQKGFVGCLNCMKIKKLCTCVVFCYQLIKPGHVLYAKFTKLAPLNAEELFIKMTKVYMGAPYNYRVQQANDVARSIVERELEKRKNDF